MGLRGVLLTLKALPLACVQLSSLQNPTPINVAIPLQSLSLTSYLAATGMPARLYCVAAIGSWKTVHCGERPASYRYLRPVCIKSSITEEGWIR